jgi:hypothetical protein
MATGGVTAILGGLDGTGNYGVDVGLVAGGSTFLVAGAVYAPETFGLSLVFGGLMYGISKGIDWVVESISTADARYHEARNNELGSHEMDDRELRYKLTELGKVRDHYEDDIKYHTSAAGGEASVKKKAEDQAILAAVYKNIENLKKAKFDGEPAYAVVDENGKATMYVNKASEQEMAQAKEAYAHGGRSIFSDSDPEALKIMGYTDELNLDKPGMPEWKESTEDKAPQYDAYWAPYGTKGREANTPGDAHWDQSVLDVAPDGTVTYGAHTYVPGAKNFDAATAVPQSTQAVANDADAPEE